MVTAELIDILPVGNELGEGVFWDARRASTWWTDIENSRLYRYRYADRQLESWEAPERVGCFAPVEGEDFLVAAFASGFAYYAPESGFFRRLHAVEEQLPGTRLNDGRCDRQGRFWAGSMVENADRAADAGALYCLDQKLDYAKKIPGLAISNSLCWSPDSFYLYHTDTPTRRISRYDFNPQSAALSNKSLFVETDTGCFPDGSTVDSEGYLWNAQWGGSQVVRYAPDGAVDFVLKLPVEQPSCVAFGGPNLNILFITTVRQGLSADALERTPNSGNLFIYETNVSGLAECEFKPHSGEIQ